MIIMALDHTRQYFHADAFLYDPQNLEKTTVFIFFTRWITHFCAPIFVLLAGSSAFLSGQQKTKKDMAVFLVKRGLWLVFLELTVVNFAWFLNIHFSFFLLGIIWVFGVCMICLSGLIFLSRKVILFIGLLLVCAHNSLDKIHFPQNNFMGFLWGIIHEEKLISTRHIQIFIAYPVMPWIGVMAIGYCLGGIFTKEFDAKKRKRILFICGFTSLILFIILRTINVYGDLFAWTSQSSAMFSFLSFINFSKFPPSLDFLLVTEGIAFIFLALTENISNGFTKFISVYGRVPLFYYLTHLYLIHGIAILAAMYLGYPRSIITSLTTVVTLVPCLRGYGFNLGVVYGIWIFVVLALYPFCKMYDRYKTSHKDKWWLSYL